MIFSKIRAFARLGARGRRMAMESLLLPLMVRSAFTLIGVSRTKEMLEVWGRRSRNALRCAPGDLIAEAVRVQRVVRKATGVGGTCLVRSLVLLAILERRGVPTQLRVGVRKQDGKMEGHAWLEYAGQPINEVPSIVATYTLFEGAAPLEGWRSA